MPRFARFVARFMQALHASRQLTAERVISQHAHLLEQAEAYERDRTIESARIVADAKTAMAQSGLQFEPRSAS